ncbi:MAG: DUF45 domain-containing protein [Rhodocyclaceae bacterium]|nr:DUF45 domain-containing protein [Rhodocyclaceae bacterium]
MSARKPQLALRLEAATPDRDVPWGAGSSIVYLGATLTLTLDTAHRMPTLIGKELHLPLPPAATPRQMRDAAESWLRDEALRIFQKSALSEGLDVTPTRQKSALAGRRPARVVLAFGKRGDWAKHDGDVLRCHWRLIEQPPAIIEQVLGRALAAMRPEPVCGDLFALA